jgi:hypothetical protein
MAAALREGTITGPQADGAPKAIDIATEAADRLVDLQLSFNLFPARYAHASWVQRCLGPMAADSSELSAAPSWLRALSAALLRHEGLDQHYDCDFFDPAKRLALLEAHTLIRIGGLVMATLLRDRLRRTISRTEVQVAEACMGAQARQYAVRWQGALPFPSPALEAGHWPSAEVWQRMSVAQLVAAIPSHAVAVTGRMRLRFPCDWALPGERGLRLSEPQRVSLTNFIVAIVVDAAPEWRWLFEPHIGHSLRQSRPECT